MERLATNKELEDRFKWLYEGEDAPEEKEPDDATWGWNNILWDLMEEIERIDEKRATVILQIKEKFGGLRFYVKFREEIDKVDRRIINACISSAESRSFQTCEVCGKYGTRRSGGWIKTLCNEHHKEREENKRKRKEHLDNERSS